MQGGPLQFAQAGVDVTLSADGIVATKTSGYGCVNSVALLAAMDDGASLEIVLAAGTYDVFFGVCKASVDVASTNCLYHGSDAWCMCASAASLYGNGKRGADAADGFAVGDRFGCRLDPGAGTLSFWKNGAPHGATHTGVVGPVRGFVEFNSEGDSVSICAHPSFEQDLAVPVAEAPEEAVGGGAAAAPGGGAVAAAVATAAVAGAATSGSGVGGGGSSSSTSSSSDDDDTTADGTRTVQSMEGGPPQFARAGRHVTLSADGIVATLTSKGRGRNSVALLGEMNDVVSLEFVLTAGTYVWFGVCKAGVDVASTKSLSSGSDAWSMSVKSGMLHGNGKRGADAAGGFAVGDRLGWRLDLGAGTLSFWKNGAPHGATHAGVVGPVRGFVEFCVPGDSVSICAHPSFEQDLAVPVAEAPEEAVGGGAAAAPGGGAVAAAIAPAVVASAATSGSGVGDGGGGGGGGSSSSSDDDDDGTTAEAAAAEAAGAAAAEEPTAPDGGVSPAAAAAPPAAPTHCPTGGGSSGRGR
jgi:hypothetical protein